MNVDIKVDVKSALKDLGNIRDKQVPYSTSLALNRTAQKVKAKQEHEIRDVFDRPTPFIQNSQFIKYSNKRNLTATVGVKDFSFGKGVPAVKPLLAEIGGGERRLKRFEMALRSAGVLPNGYMIVPGEAAEIDQYGNIKGSQIVKILSYFRAFPDVGYKANSTDASRAKMAKSTKSRYGTSYFVGAPGDGKSPLGIWQRIYSNFGTAIRPIMIFVKSTNYEPIYDFKFVAENTVQKEFNREFIRAWEEAERTAK